MKLRKDYRRRLMMLPIVAIICLLQGIMIAVVFVPALVVCHCILDDAEDTLDDIMFFFVRLIEKIY